MCDWHYKREQAVERKSCGLIDGADALLMGQSQDPFELSTGVSFQFVNIVEPHQLKRPDLRKLVKSHVKKRSNRATQIRDATIGSDETVATTQAQSKLDNARRKAIDSAVPSSIPRSVCVGSTRAFYGHGSMISTMTPNVHSLLDYCAFINIYQVSSRSRPAAADFRTDLQVIALSWYPFEARLAYNPVRSEWFPLALKDEMLFKAVLFSSASHLAYEDGRTEFEPDILLQPVLYHLNRIIQEAETFSDTTIAIVSCLAMVEVRS